MRKRYFFCNKSMLFRVFKAETMKIKETRYHILIRQYKDRIYGYSFYMMKNRMDADDVTQEVLIKIWKNIDSFNYLSAKSWIMKTTHNLCIDYLRRRKRETEYNFSVDDVDESLINKDGKKENPLFRIQLMNVKEKIKEALTRLPEKLRSVFILYEIEKFKYREIAKILDMPINSVKVYLLRARKELQKELNKYELQD